VVLEKCTCSTTGVVPISTEVAHEGIVFPTVDSSSEVFFLTKSHSSFKDFIQVLRSKRVGTGAICYDSDKARQVQVLAIFIPEAAFD